MISTIAIVIAGVSLIIVVVTMCRNTSNPVALIDSEMGTNGIVEIQTTPTLECQIEPIQSTEITIVDSELNLIV